MTNGPRPPRFEDERRSSIAAVVYEDAATLERQESRPEVHMVMAIVPGPDTSNSEPERLELARRSSADVDVTLYWHPLSTS
jgi:hypothetical protein